MVLAGGEGGLLPLTNDRAKPAVPFGGSYRLIDFVLCNFARARYTRIVVLTQYKSHSLDLHISRTWRFSTLLGSYVSSVPAQMRLGPHWFSGSADAIYQNLNLITDEKPDIVCVFGADHIYRMDPRQMVDYHREHGGGVTVADIPVPSRSGVGVRDHRGERRGHDHPVPREARGPAADARQPRDVSGIDGQLRVRHRRAHRGRHARQLTGLPHDIGGDLMPRLAERAERRRVYDFSTNEVPGQGERERGYWRDVGTVDAYYDANMDLVASVPVFSLYNEDWPVYSLQLPRPPAKLGHGGGEDDGRGAARCARARSCRVASSTDRSSAPTCSSIRARSSPSRSCSRASRSAMARSCTAA